MWWFSWFLFPPGQIDGQEITVTAVLTPTVRVPPRRMSPPRRMPPPPPMWRRTPPRMRRRWAAWSGTQVLFYHSWYISKLPSHFLALLGLGLHGDALPSAAGLDPPAAAATGPAPALTPRANDWQIPRLDLLIYRVLKISVTNILMVNCFKQWMMSHLVDSFKLLWNTGTCSVLNVKKQALEDKGVLWGV